MLPASEIVQDQSQNGGDVLVLTKFQHPAPSLSGLLGTRLGYVDDLGCRRNNVGTPLLKLIETAWLLLERHGPYVWNTKLARVILVGKIW